MDATLLCVASVIGSGIFLTPGTIAERLPHAGLILAVWLAGGVLSLLGALANAELGAMYPHAGGDYVYLREVLAVRRLRDRLSVVLRDLHQYGRDPGRGPRRSAGRSCRSAKREARRRTRFTFAASWLSGRCAAARVNNAGARCSSWSRWARRTARAVLVRR
jgi:amino acid transporter